MPKKKINKKKNKKQESIFNGNITAKRISLVIAILFLGVFLIFSTYAWFSTALNVKIKQFNMIVARNSGISISLDGINFDSAVELSRDLLINDLKKTYPNHKNRWSASGLTPISSPGITNHNDYFFDIYQTGGVRYRSRSHENGFIHVAKIKETDAVAYSRFVSFDVFFKNVTGSPIADNLYFDYGCEVSSQGEISEEMQGLVNSVRIGIVKVGTLALDANPSDIQNMKCQGECNSIIFEPNSENHTNLSIERAQKYGIKLTDGERFPTYASIKEGGPLLVGDNVSGSEKLDLNYFTIQRTIHEEDFGRALFTVPDGITKARIYVWIEGQDIDSLETDSEGSELYINLNFIKDTAGYQVD